MTNEFIFNIPIVDTGIKNKPIMIKAVYKENTGDFYADSYIVSIVGKSRRKDTFHHWVDNGVNKFRVSRSYFEFEMPLLYEWMKAHGYRF